MHKYLILFFSAVLFLCSCNGKSVPGDVLQPNEMVNVLTEMHIIDGSLYNGLQTPDSLYKYGAGKYFAMFQKFHTDSGTFRKSIRYYSTDLDRLAAIYDQVDLRLKTKTDSVNDLLTKQGRAGHKRDSINNIKLNQRNATSPSNMSPMERRIDSIRRAGPHTPPNMNPALRRRIDSLKNNSKQKQKNALPKK